MGDPNPYQVIRDYLKQISAPSDALEHIADRLGWRPPPIWEMPHAAADAVNASVEPPEGMRHVGWYCEHPLSRTSPYVRDPRHREWSGKNKRGWKWNKNVGRSLSFGTYDSEACCPQRVPVFIRATR